MYICGYMIALSNGSNREVLWIIPIFALSNGPNSEVLWIIPIFGVILGQNVGI